MSIVLAALSSIPKPDCVGERNSTMHGQQGNGIRKLVGTGIPKIIRRLMKIPSTAVMMQDKKCIEFGHFFVLFTYTHPAAIFRTRFHSPGLERGPNVRRFLCGAILQ